ncbi:MAG: uncharacterized protein QOE65_2095 [Solirubrobacteraceae bacterium]|jgi:predicted metalloprotease|nr:uncharacterized protein [Solirubrobacteraceae bacterium]
MRRVTCTALSACALVAGGCGDSKDEPEQRASGGFAAASYPRGAGDPAATASPRGGIATLRALGPVRRPSPGTAVPKLRGSDIPLTAFLGTVANDVAGFWQSQYNRAGKRFPATRFLVVTKPVPSGCAEKPIEPTNPFAFYCPTDRTVFLPVTYIDRRYRILGDAPVGFVVAHEFAHRVQDVTGTLRRKAEGKLFTRQTELQADCLAGVWAASVYARGDLDPDDLTEFFNALASIGDPPGTPENHPQAHGTPAEREASFKRGYDAANANACPERT